jgi:hypothetical protein
MVDFTGTATATLTLLHLLQLLLVQMLQLTLLLQVLQLLLLLQMLQLQMLQVLLLLWMLQLLQPVKLSKRQHAGLSVSAVVQVTLLSCLIYKLILQLPLKCYSLRISASFLLSITVVQQCCCYVSYEPLLDWQSLLHTLTEFSQ